MSFLSNLKIQKNVKTLSLAAMAMAFVSQSALAQTFTIQGNSVTTGNQQVENQLTVNGNASLQGVTSTNALNTYALLSATQGLSVSGALNAGNITSSGTISANYITASGTVNVTGTFVLPTQTTAPSAPCTPGQMLMGPGGSNSNGKGGYLFFCRLGGTWATADFGNASAVATDQPETEGDVAALRAEVKALKALVCASQPKAKAKAQICAGGRS